MGRHIGGHEGSDCLGISDVGGLGVRAVGGLGVGGLARQLADASNRTLPN